MGCSCCRRARSRSANNPHDRRLWDWCASSGLALEYPALGAVRYDGLVTDLVRQAAGRVWLADEPDPAASVSWRTGTGRYRNIGTRVRDDAEHAEPSLEDAYLLLRGGSPEHEPAGEVAS